MSSPSQNAAEQAIQEVEKKFQQALDYINQMQADYAAEQSDLNKAGYDKAHEHYTTGHMSGCSPSTAHWSHNTYTDKSMVNAYNKAMADYAAKDKDRLKCQAALKALDPAFDALCNTLNSLIAMMTNLVKKDNVGGALVTDDFNSISKEVQSLFKAMSEKVNADKYQEEIKVAIDNGLSPGQVGDLVSQMTQNETTELSDLLDMQKGLEALLQIYQKQSKKAEEDKDKYTIWDKLGPDCDEVASKISQDKRIMDNANEMMIGIRNVLSALSAETSNLMPEFQVIVTEIQQLVQEIRTFIQEMKDPNVSKAQKMADFEKVLAFVMYLLTQVQVLKQQVENNKVKNSQDMLQGTIQASKNNIYQTEAQEIIKKELEHAAKVAKITMIVLQATVGVLMMIGSGGFGAAFMVGCCTAYETLNTAGVLNANQELGSEMHSQIGADIVIGLIEALATFGGGIAIDCALSKAYRAVAMRVGEAVVEDSEEKIAQKANEIAAKQADRAAENVVVPKDEENPIVNASFQAAKKEAYDQAYDKAYDAAYETLRKQALSAAEKAGVRATQQFFKQSLGTLMGTAFKREFTLQLERVAETATEDAVQDSIEESIALAELAASGVESSDEIMEEITDRNANQAVAKVANTTPEKVADTADKMGWGPKRFIAMMVAGLLNNNVLVDGLKKAGMSDDSLLSDLVSVLQQLMAMILLMGGTGSFSTVSMEGIMSKIPRYATLLSLIPTGAQAGGSYQMYETDMAQSKAVTALQELEGESSLLNDFLDMLKQQSTIDRNGMLTDQQRDAQSTNEMAGHLHDGELAEINVLISAIG